MVGLDGLKRSFPTLMILRFQSVKVKQVNSYAYCWHLPMVSICSSTVTDAENTLDAFLMSHSHVCNHGNCLSEVLQLQTSRKPSAKESVY